MNCTNCGNTFNDGVQCGSCKRHLDFSCAQITEVSWRKMGMERRAAWKCTSCRSLSPSPSPVSTAEPASLDLVLKEIRDLKTQLASLPALIDDLKSIKQEMADIKSSCEFAISKVDEFGPRLSDIELRISNLERLEETVCSVQSQVNYIKSELSANDQRSRLNNVEIKGVQLKKDENLFNIVKSIGDKVNYSFPMSQINYVYRVPVHNSKDKSIIVSFINRYIKEEFVAAARATKTLTANDIGFKDSSQRIYVNDHLSADSKNLLNKVKTLAKERDYRFVWIKYGKIHVRKNDVSRVFIVNKENDLNKLS